MRRQTVTDPRGSALLPVTLVLFLFSAIAIGAALVVRVELMVAERFRQSAEALYAAEAALQVAIAELEALPDWTPVVDGGHRSRFADGSFTGSKRVPGGGSVTVCCGAGSAFERLTSESQASPVPARRALAWQPFLWATFDALVPRDPATRLYVLVFIADSADEEAATDEAVLVRAEAIDPGGLRRTIESLVARRPAQNPELVTTAANGPLQSDEMPASAPVFRVLTWREVR
jgi:hypothetical protein